MLGTLPLMLGIVPLVENTAMDLGMQGLDPAIKHFREAGKLGDIANRNTGLANFFGRATGRQDIDSEFSQLFGKALNPRFIGQTDQCSCYLIHSQLLF